MNRYFQTLVERLSLDDIEVLNSLIKNESTNRFSSTTKKEIQEVSKLTESKFRKSIARLEAMNFLEITAGSREHVLYVTEYGLEAIQNIYERSNV